MVKLPRSPWDSYYIGGYGGDLGYMKSLPLKEAQMETNNKNHSAGKDHRTYVWCKVKK